MVEPMGAGKRRKQWVLWGGVAWVTLFLFWLPVEDISLWPALALGALGMAWLFMRWRLGTVRTVRRWLCIAGAAGLGIPVGALLLLVFKSGAHGHGFFELPLALLARLLPQIPVWVLVGMFYGCFIERGLAYLRRQAD
ncbi:MAG TPA: hypothetical protein VF982_11300 [Anaerolineales bacterium]